MPREKGAPPQVSPKGLADYLEVMSKSVFQSGISWDVVEAKWEGTREALHGFEPGWLAALSGKQIDALMQDTRLIRNRKKIEALSSNAARALELEREHGSFKKYLKSHGDFEAVVKALRKDFKFLGETGCYHFLYVVREPVPDWHEWRESRGAAAGRWQRRAGAG
jgi:3-methyladenine DNA glycosylase Tag